MKPGGQEKIVSLFPGTLLTDMILDRQICNVNQS